MIEDLLPTKEIILISAKEKFYSDGYSGTTISDIFSSIDVPVGVFTYHFKTKDVLVTEIYRRFFKNLRKRILSQYCDLKDQPFLCQAILSKMYHDIILSDKNNSRFYYQVLHKRSNYRINADIVKEIFRQYIKQYNLIISDNEFETLMILDAGARQEYFINYFKKNQFVHPYEISNTLEAILPLLFRIDPSIVDSVLFTSDKIVRTIDYSDIKLLI